ncbi:hypothetical protein ACFQI7_11760 [Paenibacillus allorhizosphaerae]|uniref:Uncharacterized protein n=1 Tax=Paenibacillus allorhizosphaerae TaxID=2849866 RepID=A0ABM8VH94_9BACL|nr:hypothetical protein [Paenibacillus allorhizosphaerae]CAG7641375.1 hypothetical protein PAECIP111802_02734 [Paenibacillus allorhizosphaerae]
MNAGYLSFVLIVVSLILFASGWKDILIRGISHSRLLLFFVAWVIAFRWSMEWNGMQIYGVAPLLLFTALFVFLRSYEAFQRLHALSVGLLLGSIFFFLKETIHLMPALIVYSSSVTIALISGTMVSVALRRPAVQIAAISLGFVTGEAMYAYSHHNQTHVSLGGTSFQDLWWLTVFAARGISLVLQQTALGFKKAAVFVWETIRQRKP